MPAGVKCPAFQAIVGDLVETPGAVAKVIAFAGHKGGTGKSLLAQGFAVQAARNSHSVVLVDLDIDQQTSFEWAQARLLNKYKPKVCAALIDPAARSDFGLGTARLGFDVLVVDAPGWSDERTLRLAAIADLMVLPATPTVADLRPTIRLMHELKAQGIPDSRMVIAVNHVRAARELTFARTYLKEAGLAALPKSISPSAVASKAVAARSMASTSSASVGGSFSRAGSSKGNKDAATGLMSASFSS